MDSGGKTVNPREEEKELDDKLMELGLLEPGMTLQEKRELASVVLESTRMAEEQMSQRNAEEQWETSLISPEATGLNDAASDSESPEFIAISISKTQSDRPSTSRAGNQRRRDKPELFQRETTGKGKNWTEKDVRIRRGKRERDVDSTAKGELVILEVEEDEEMEERKGRRVEARKEPSSSSWQLTRRKREGDHTKRECEVGKPQRKLLGAEEIKEKKGVREVEIKEKGGKGVEEKRGRKDMEVTLDEDQESDSKVVATSDDQTEKTTKATDSFYGPSCSSNAKELNPLRSELHGYSRKRRPPRSSQVSLLQLAKEDVPQRKKPLNEAEIEELVLDDETSHEENKCDDTLVRNFNGNKPSAEAKDAEDRRLFLEKHPRGRKTVQEKAEEGKPGADIMDDDDDDWETPQGGKIWIKESRKRNGGLSGLKEGALQTSRGNSEKTLSLLTGAGKMKRREQDEEAEIEDGSEVDDEEKCGGEPRSSKIPPGDFILEGKEKRQLPRAASSKKWVDVVIFPSSSSGCVSKVHTKEMPKSDKKLALPPNKRWRRVKRKVKSSFGSGSEVDEWISSEEEQKPQGVALSKEQLIARFDKQLSHLSAALKEEHLKKPSSGSKYSRCKLCEKKSPMKVPPGFQEPDSDDEWNLWKICFSNPLTSDEELKKHSKEEKVKPDAIPLMYKPAVTRSQAKQMRELGSPRSVSKSPVSSEGDMFSSPPEAAPEAKGKSSALDIAPSDDTALWNKSPLLGEVVLFDKVIHSRSSVTKGTQTPGEDDRNSSASGSQSGSVELRSKSKEGSQVVEPVWDLLEINSEGEEVVRHSEGMEVSGGGIERRAKNVTVRRVHNESPEYLPLKLTDEDIPLASISVEHHPETPGRRLAPSLFEPIAVPSPVIPKGSRRGKLRAVEEREVGHSRNMDRIQSRGRKVDIHITDVEEGEEVFELEPAPESKADEAIPCPLCNKEFPITEIEAHASECNQEEEEELPRRLRHGRCKQQEEEVEAREVAGASYHQSLDVEMEECEEVEDDDGEFEAASSSQRHGPRPAPLSTYVPISQQKDSLIDYSNQFPHGSGNVDLRGTLERMRRSLLTRVRKKTRWRKKRRPKWRNKKL